MRLLVIEDDATLRETLCSQLAEEGFGIEQAADGREGLYFALEYPIDLAIVDLGLPEISGLDIIRELREKGKSYPILILTARDRWQDKVDASSKVSTRIRSDAFSTAAFSFASFTASFSGSNCSFNIASAPV